MKLATGTIVIAALISAPAFADSSANEKQIWSLEGNYWKYVQANDLVHYRSLWHEDFLGWPLASPEPVRKDHITDWITAHTSVGETLKNYELERLVTQSSRDYVTVTYRVRLTWAAQDGTEKPGGLRVIHTWLHDPVHGWQILSGMAAAPNAQGH